MYLLVCSITEVRDIFHAGEGGSGGSGCPRTALTLASSRRAVPRRCQTTRDIRAHLWARCTGAATGGTSSILPCLFVAEALDREWSRGRGTRLHCRRSVSVPRVLPSRMQRSGLPAGENQPVRQLHRAGAATVRRPSKVASKGGRPRRKAAQENKAAKDTEDPLVRFFRGRRRPWWSSTARNLDGQEAGA